MSNGPALPTLNDVVPASPVMSDAPADAVAAEEVSDEALGLEFYEGFAEAEASADAGGESDGDAPNGGQDVAPSTPAGVTPETVQAVTPPVAEASQTPPTDGTPAPAAVAAAPVVAPAPVQPVAGQPAQEQPAPTPAAAESSPSDPNDMLGNIRVELDRNRDVFTQVLADKTYAMSEEESRTLFEAPEKVLPRLAAKVHLEVVQNVLGTLGQILPGTIFAVQQAQVQQNALLEDFWGSHPTLDRKADHASVMEIARVYRQQNPSASFDDFKKVVGSTAMVRLGKLPVAPGQVPVAVAPVRGAPTAPAARGSTPLAPVAPPSGSDFWGAFAENLEEGG